MSPLWTTSLSIKNLFLKHIMNKLYSIQFVVESQVTHPNNHFYIPTGTSWRLYTVSELQLLGRGIFSMFNCLTNN